MAFAEGYEFVKRADDRRWTNTKRRDVAKATAEIGDRTAEVHAEGWRLIQTAKTDRLNAAKRSVAAFGDAFSRMVVRKNADHVLSTVPVADGMWAAYDRMMTGDRLVRGPEAVEESLRNILSHHIQRLADCRNRVAEKMRKADDLRPRLVEARREAANRRKSRVEKGRAEPTTHAAVAKTMDALIVANAHAKRVCDLVADNAHMMDAINDQLTEDVRQQAAAVVKVLSYNTAAQEDAAAYNRLQCRAKADHREVMERKSKQKRRMKTKMATLEYNRNMISSLDQKVPVKELEISTSKNYSSSNLSDSTQSLSSESYHSEVIPLVDWIDTGPLESQIYPKKDSFSLQDTIESNLSLKTDINIHTSIDTSSSDENNYTYPVDKINVFKFEQQDHSREIEAVEYVCSTLGFSNTSDVLQYITSVKSIEMRLKQMMSLRNHLYEIQKNRLDSALEFEMTTLNYLPESISKLDANLERVQREGFDEQKQHLEDTNKEIEKYGKLFNELWFLLDNLTGKLDRCQVPVVRKYQKKRAADTNDMIEADQMLRGLCLSDDRLDNWTPSPSQTRNSMENEKGDQSEGLVDNDGNHVHSAVNACREALATLHVKVKSCMVHIGSDFDMIDQQQREQKTKMARAYFDFNQQMLLQTTMATKQQKHRSRSAERMVGVANRPVTGISAAPVILTREQTKRQADDIVRWWSAPKDSDKAKRMRKPISFRKSLMVV